MNEENQYNEAIDPGSIEPAGVHPESPEDALELAGPDLDELFAEMLSAEQASDLEAGETVDVSAQTVEAADLPEPVAIESLAVEPEAPEEWAAEPLPEPVAIEALAVEPETPAEWAAETLPEPVAIESLAVEPETPAEWAAEPLPEPVAIEALAPEPEAPAEWAAEPLPEPVEIEALIEAASVEPAEMDLESVPEPEFPSLDMASAEAPLDEPSALDFETVLAAAAAPVEFEPIGEPAGFDFLEAGVAAPEPPAAAGFDASEAMLRELLAEESSQLLEAVQAPERLTESETGRSSPPLEDLIRGIDSQLETVATAAAPVEQPAPAHKQFSQLDDYVVFTLSGGDYALPVRDVAEIGRVPSVTKVPNVPEFVRGITNLRGEIVPVLNLPQLLGLQETALTARGRVLFLQARDQVAASGLLVDEVKGIQRIPSQQLEHVTGLVDDKVTSVLRGVHGRGDRLLNVLDLEQVFRLEEFQRFDRR